MLHARVLLRLRRTTDALAYLTLCAGGQLLTADQKATYHLLLGVAHTTLGRLEEADGAFARAHTFASAEEVRAELNYAESLALYQAGRLADARARLAASTGVEGTLTYAMAHDLLGWIETAEERHLAAHENFTLALRALKHCPEHDSHARAKILSVVSVGEAELRRGDPSWLDDEVGWINWKSHMVAQKVQTLRHIGLAYQRNGQLEAAAERFMASIDVAPDAGWAVFGFAEAAELARANGDRASAAAFLYRARRIAEHYAWENVNGEERLGLLVLAAVFARMGGGEIAKRYFDVYWDSASSPFDSLSRDHRSTVVETHVAGLVAGSTGDLERARELIINAQTEFSRLKYEFRAIEALNDLRNLEPPESQAFIDRAIAARRALIPRDLPNNVEAPARRSRGRSLTARESDLLRLVLAGKDDVSIADALGITRKTVRNNLHELYAHFDVRKRSDLITRVADQDIGLFLMCRVHERQARVDRAANSGTHVEPLSPSDLAALA